MSVEVKLTCNGCFEEVTYIMPDVEIHTISTNSNWSKVVFPQIRDYAPEGWWAYDPYTFMQYCPACRDSIEND